MAGHLSLKNVLCCYHIFSSFSLLQGLTTVAIPDSGDQKPYEGMGWEWFCIANGLSSTIMCIAGWVFDVGYVELRLLISRLSPLQLSIVIITAVVLQPQTDSEVLFWFIWCIVTFFVVTLSAVSRVRIEQGHHLITQSPRLLALNIISLLLSGSSVIAAAVLLYGTPIKYTVLVSQLHIRSFLTACSSTSKQYVHSRASNGWIDYDGHAKFITLLTEYPARIVHMWATWYLFVMIGSYPIRVLMCFISFFDLFKLLRITSEVCRVSKVIQIRKPVMNEFRTYHNPCAICYDVMCYQTCQSELQQIASSDAAIAAVLVYLSSTVSDAVPQPDPLHDDFELPKTSDSPPPTPGNSIVPFSVPPTMSPRILNCGHIYHTKCLQDWMREKLECPLCKSSIEVS